MGERVTDSIICIRYFKGYEFREYTFTMQISEFIQKILTALSIKIKCFTADGTELQGIERYDYNSLSAASYKNVGENIPIILPDQNTYKVEIIPLSIMLEDEVKWQNETEEAFQVVVLLRKPIPEYSNEDEESFEYYVEQYKRDIAANVKNERAHKYLPEFNDDYIICGCDNSC